MKRRLLAMTLVGISVFAFSMPSFAQEAKDPVKPLEKASAKVAQKPEAAVDPVLYKIPESARKFAKTKDGRPISEEQEGRSVVPSIDTMTKAELVAEIIDTIDTESDILDYIIQLKKGKTSDGKDVYLYVTENKSVEIKDLDEDTLRKIVVMVHQTATRVRTERISRQLETIRQTQRLSATVPSNPVVTMPPSLPSVATVSPAQRGVAPVLPAQSSTPRIPPQPPKR